MTYGVSGEVRELVLLFRKREVEIACVWSNALREYKMEKCGMGEEKAREYKQGSTNKYIMM
jgi:hypothetical protein